MDGTKTPLTAARRAASLLGLAALCTSVLFLEGLELLVADVEASSRMAKAWLSGVDTDGSPMLDLNCVTKGMNQHGGMTHP